jgi:hypothetical protein
MESKALDHVMDALDIETFLVCGSEQEGRALLLDLMKQMGFTDVDVVFIQQRGFSARVRARAYVHRPADKYRWLTAQKGV